MSANAVDKLKPLATRLSLIGLSLVTVGLVYFGLTPNLYRAAARIETHDWIHASDPKPNDAIFVASQCQLIRSPAILDETSRQLALSELWGKQRHGGTPLNTEETRELLLAMADVHPVPHSALVEIRVTSKDAVETAKIANGLARAYCAHTRAQQQDLINSNITSLKKLWNAQAQKIQAAQADVDKMYFAISRDRATNHVKYYDPESYELLSTQRVRLESEFVQQRNELAQLKKLSRDDLKQVLSSLDTDPNSPLTASLREMGRAKTDLALAQDHGPDSPEVKHAELVIEELNQRLNRAIDATVTARETSLASLKTMLGEFSAKLDHGSTNLNQAQDQYSPYATALEQLNKLKQERDDLQMQMNKTDSHDALMIAGITAVILNNAETPGRPFIPDRRIAFGTVSAGLAAAMVGCLLLILKPKPNPKPEQEFVLPKRN